MRIKSTRFLSILTCSLYILIMFYCYHFFATQQTDDVSLSTKPETPTKAEKISYLKITFNFATSKNNQNQQTKPQQIDKTSLINEKAGNGNDKISTIENTFHSIIDKNLYVFSIYEDQRDSKKKKLIFLIYKKRLYDPQLWCHYLNPNKTSHKAIYPMTDLRGNKDKFYELCENHDQQFGGYFGVCEMPMNVTKGKLFVAVSSSDPNNSHLLPTLPVHRMINHDGAVVSNTSWKLGLCVPTLFGKVNHKELFEFFTVIKSLGIDHVTMYVDFTILSNEVKSVLKYFEKSDYLFVIPWKLPGIDKESWNYAQILNVNDCLYRSMNKYEYVAFHDVDEFIVPRGNLQNIKQLVEKYWKKDKNLCGICLKSVFFPPTMKNEDNSTEHFRILTLRKRTSVVSNVRVKCLVKPKRIYEMGIHHISKPYQEYFVNIKVDERDALLHHYRECLSDFGMDCNQYIHDNYLVTFFQQANVQQKWQNYSAADGA